MGERPIIFSTEMVKAVLDDRKTMTRRMIKPQPSSYIFDVGHLAWKNHVLPPEMLIQFCPYGQVGDKLWVRETWRPYSEKEVRIEYKAGGVIIDYPEQPDFMFYACGEKWHSPLFMSRWASRINRIIRELRAERLLDITLADAIREGFNSIEEFLDYWDILNKKSGYGREVNPWNWVIGW